MAIAFRANATGASVNAATSTIALPAGTTTGDVTVLFAQQATGSAAAGAVPTMTPPAGWTMLVAFNGVIVCWRAWQAGDPATGILFTSNLSGWWLSLAVTYSGCDTAAPIDAACPCFNITGVAVSATFNNIFRAPSICPNFNASVLLTLYSNGGSAGGTIAVPGGTTSRANTAVGPSLLICEKTLTDGTPTGDIDTTRAANTDSHFGMSLALKASGAVGATLATARPTFGAIFNSNLSTGPIGFPLDHLNVQNGDLVIAFFSGNGTALTAPGGWTQLTSVQGAWCFYRRWLTGDSTTPIFSWTGGAGTFFAIDGLCLRRAGSGTTNPTIDTSGVNSATVTATTPVLTPSGAAEMLFAYIGTRTAAAGTWSGVTGGLSNIDISTAGPSYRFSSLMPSGSPTTSYSATFSVGGTAVDALAVLVGSAAAVVTTTAQARVMVMA